MHTRVSRGLGAAAVAVVAFTGCGGDDDGATATVAESAAPAAEDVVIIDVRTPEEFAAGHVGDAVNLDAQSPDFAARIADLDPGAEYLVYCRTGNRSAAATTEMRATGLVVEDGGGLEDMVTAGYEIVTD